MKPFNRDRWAEKYAKNHLETDPGIRAVVYLPHGAPEREIRLVGINEQIAERERDSVEPFDMAVGRAHSLQVIDVTPNQWKRIEKNELPIPPGWSLTNRKVFERVAVE